MIASNSFFILASIAGLLQVCFLPGWIITHFLKLKGSLVWRLIAGFGLSLMCNYWIIFILTSLHIYNRVSLVILICIELIILFFISKEKNGEKVSTAWLREELLGEKKNYVKIIGFSFAILTFAYLAFLFVENIGTIFKLSDAVLSWNRWAVEWSTSAFPKYTWEYPQLLPTNWSLLYVMVGTPLEFLAKMTLPLFPLGVALTLFLVGLKKKSWAFIIAVPATILLMRLMIGSEIMATEGYVDTAVAFFGLFSILSLFWNEKPTSKDLLVGALFAAGTLMTKQAGFFIIIIYPVLAWIIILRHNLELRKSWIKYLIIYLALLVILAGPFYIYKQFAINSHEDISVVSTIDTLIYGSGKSPLAVSAYALYFLIGKTHGLILLYLILLIVAIRDRRYRWPILFGAILYSIIWSLFNSYDTRNLTLALPFWGLAAGLGIERFENSFNMFVSKIKPLYLILFLIVVAVGISPWIKGKVFESYNHEKRYMVDTDLSVLLNSYFGSHSDNVKILTNYSALYFFPQLKDHIYSPYGGFSTVHNDFDNYKVDSLNSHVTYILAAFYSDKAVFEDIENNVKSGRFTLIFNSNGNILVKTGNHVDH